MSRLFPKLPNGLANFSAPYWNGDTAERVLADRLANPPQKTKRSRGSGTRTRAESTTDPRVKRLRRLERNLPRRKTIVAQQRIAKEIEELKAELAAQ